MNKTGMMCFLIALFGVADWANAVCPEKPVSICQIVRQHPVVVRAKVASTQRLVDEDDPEGVAGRRNRKSWHVCATRTMASRTEENNCFRSKVVRSVALNASLYMDPKCVRYQTGFKNP
jgi:hypothetical protein